MKIYSHYDKLKITSLMYHIKTPPENCKSCLFTRDRYDPRDFTNCYFKVEPVSLIMKGCPPEFFVRYLLEML